jgi:hypothetical protein
MDKRSKVFICAAASYWFLLVAAIVGRSRKRKRIARREGISYAPMAERDRKRIEYLNDKIWRNDTTCVDMLSCGGRINLLLVSHTAIYLWSN